MDTRNSAIPLNALRAFAEIAREASITKAAQALGTTQSSVSRHLAVLEEFIGDKLVERSGRNIRLTQLGYVLAESISEPMETIAFSANRMRRPNRSGHRILVRTSLPTLTNLFVLPHLPDFVREHGAIVDFYTSLTPTESRERFDVLLTRDLQLELPSDEWVLADESVVCAGHPDRVEKLGALAIRSTPLLTATSRPDLVSRMVQHLGLNESDVTLGSNFDHHYMTVAAAEANLGLYIGPELYMQSAADSGALRIIPESRFETEMRYRALALDSSPNVDLAREFCKWLARLCKAVG